MGLYGHFNLCCGYVLDAGRLALLRAVIDIWTASNDNHARWLPTPPS